MGQYEHRPDGDPCARCGLGPARHRVRPGRRGPRGERPARAPDPIVAIDGEGRGRSPHLYVYLAAVDDGGGKRGGVWNDAGLSTHQCLEFLTGLGTPRVFGYSLGYDLAMWLRDLPDEKLFMLVRPERRAYLSDDGRIRHRPVYWQGWRLTFLRGRLTVQRVVWDAEARRNVPAGPRVTVWDVFRFFGTRFVDAIAAWRVVDPKHPKLVQIREMKERRADSFAGESDARVAEYCDDECLLMAWLVRDLQRAHEDAGLRLQSFFGAGSTATALLRRMRVREYRADPPAEMRDELARGFFGGRFEHSRVGPVRGPLHARDIASAYPYATYFLPCLRCGFWRHTTDPRDLEGATCALVRCEVRTSGPSAWGPLPFRQRDGTIIFPRACESTWVWQDEYRAARRVFPGVRMTGAWVYRTRCPHRPFEEIRDIYLERLRIGKDGKGLALKLGMNSVYGKLAQSLGAAPFQSWVWAGMITSSTRAQLLACLGAARDPWDVLGFATDGVLSRSPLALPQPRDTGTAEVAAALDKSALGAWEAKDGPWGRGAFLLRPGVLFPLDPSEDALSEIRARGVSKRALLDHAERIASHYRETGGADDYVVGGLTRFVGLMQGVGPGKRGRIRRVKMFADWTDDHEVCVSFAAAPKRCRALRDGRLEPWAFPAAGGASCPYDNAVESPEAAALRELELMLKDQPDGEI